MIGSNIDQLVLRDGALLSPQYLLRYPITIHSQLVEFSTEFTRQGFVNSRLAVPSVAELPHCSRHHLAAILTRGNVGNGPPSWRRVGV
jgi:hypothetical protein